MKPASKLPCVIRCAESRTGLPLPGRVSAAADCLRGVLVTVLFPKGLLSFGFMSAFICFFSACAQALLLDDFMHFLNLGLTISCLRHHVFRNERMDLL